MGAHALDLHLWRVGAGDQGKSESFEGSRGGQLGLRGHTSSEAVCVALSPASQLTQGSCSSDVHGTLRDHIHATVLPASSTSNFFVQIHLLEAGLAFHASQSQNKLTELTICVSVMEEG